jgi:glycosyltransferase involved in cell wall biosynthesis
VATAFTLRGRSALPGVLPTGVEAVGPPVPARLLRQVWRRAPVPTIGMLTGRLDLFHATNFVLPPPGRAAGVVTVHDLSFLRSPRTVDAASRAYRELVPLSVHRAAVVVTPSHAVADEVAETYGVSPDRLAAIPLGVSDEWFTTPRPDPEARQRLGLPERYFLFVGSLEPRKNLPLLLDAYRSALHEGRDVPALVLLGPPGWGPALDTAGIPQGKLLFTGYRSDDELRATVAGSAALVYPSSYEGFGLPPLEAFACGVPVIASDLSVVREVVGEDGRLAVRVPPGDTAALTQALLDRAASDESPSLAEERRAHARGFSWHATAQATLEVYERAATAVRRG